MWNYIRYFFYLAVNWNPRIAFHLIKQEITGEKKYGIHTTGADELKSLQKKGIDITHATIYMPVSYELLDALFKQLKRSSSQPVHHFLDIGCGKGRTLCVAAHQGFNKLTGIDFAKYLCDTAVKNLNITRKQFPSLDFDVINNDAFYFEIPDDVDCIFLFNPFDEIIMSGVVQNILNSLEAYPRNLSILYVNPLHKEYFINAGFTETWQSKKMTYLEGVILENK